METPIKKIARKYKLSSRELEKILNKSQASISKYMNGSVEMDISSYLIIADHLKISLDEIFERDSELVSIPKKKYDQLLETIKNLNELLK